MAAYFDPKSGKLTERVDRLVKQDGELQVLLARAVGEQSLMTRTLDAYMGLNSPLMKCVRKLMLSKSCMLVGVSCVCLFVKASRHRL